MIAFIRLCCKKVWELLNLQGWAGHLRISGWTNLTCNRSKLIICWSTLLACRQNCPVIGICLSKYLSLVGFRNVFHHLCQSVVATAPAWRQSSSQQSTYFCSCVVTKIRTYMVPILVPLSCCQFSPVWTKFCSPLLLWEQVFFLTLSVFSKALTLEKKMLAKGIKWRNIH